MAERALDGPRNLTSTSLQPPRHLKSNIENHNNKIEKRITIKEGIKTIQGGSPNGGGASLPVVTIRIDDWRKSTQNRR
jgi:tRNA U34 5-carboxymethylaminomethyl modifying GTPase MnmE/TrmE